MPDEQNRLCQESRKTKDGELISAYACDVKTVDAEFLLAKRQYHTITGRTHKSDVIAYQIRQSFKPGEVSPEDANQLGYELAMRFLRGKHAFIVATHCDKQHIHNHIIFNSTTLDCHGKFRDFLGSGKAVARLSDLICMEHHLSVIEDPRLGNHSYNKWLGANAKPSHRERLRAAIDVALTNKPVDFESFLKLMTDAGYTVKRGAHITFRASGQKQGIRLRSLGEGYSEDALRAVIAGKAEHTPCKKYALAAKKENSLLIDIEAKIRAGKSVGYQHWAKKFNLKQMAQTLSYLQEHGLLDYQELARQTAGVKARSKELSASIRAAEERLAEISALKKHIINYSNTREVYVAYRKAGYSRQYFSEHESEILLHKAAKKAFDELGVKKLPTIKRLDQEYVALLSEKKVTYAEYRIICEKMKTLMTHKANVDSILGDHKANDVLLER